MRGLTCYFVLLAQYALSSFGPVVPWPFWALARLTTLALWLDLLAVYAIGLLVPLAFDPFGLLPLALGSFWPFVPLDPLSFGP